MKLQVRNFLQKCALKMLKNEVYETSCKFASWICKTEAILRDFLQKWCPRTIASSDFPIPFIWSSVPATKKCGQVIQSAAPVMENHLSESDNQKLQNATPSGNERRDHVWRRRLLYCACHANYIFLEPVESSDAIFLKSLATFCLLLWKCRIHGPRREKWPLKVEKWYERAAVLAFRLRHVLGAAAVCTFSMAQLPRALRPSGVLTSTLAPQLRAVPQRLNFQAIRPWRVSINVNLLQRREDGEERNWNHIGLGIWYPCKNATAGFNCRSQLCRKQGAWRKASRSYWTTRRWSCGLCASLRVNFFWFLNNCFPAEMRAQK